MNDATENTYEEDAYDADVMDDDTSEVMVRKSALIEDEIVVYDHCGRYVPVHFVDIPDLIEMLIEHMTYFNIRELDPIDPADVQKMVS